MLQPKIFYKQADDSHYSQLVFDEDKNRIVRAGEYFLSDISQKTQPINGKSLNVKAQGVDRLGANLALLFDFASSCAKIHQTPVATIKFNREGIGASPYENAETVEALAKAGCVKAVEILLYPTPFA